MEYAIGCHYDAPTDSLVLAGGDLEGNLVLSKVHPDRLEPSVAVRTGRDLLEHHRLGLGLVSRWLLLTCVS